MSLKYIIDFMSCYVSVGIFMSGGLSILALLLNNTLKSLLLQSISSLLSGTMKKLSPQAFLYLYYS